MKLNNVPGEDSNTKSIGPLLLNLKINFPGLSRPLISVKGSVLIKWDLEMLRLVHRSSVERCATVSEMRLLFTTEISTVSDSSKERGEVTLNLQYKGSMERLKLLTGLIWVGP